MAKRRRKSKGIWESNYVQKEHASSPMDVILPLGAIIAVAGVGYILYTKGVGGAIKTGGGVLDKISGTLGLGFDALGKTVGGAQRWFGDVGKGISDFDRREWAKLDAIGEGLGNASCWFQKRIDPSKKCTDLNKNDLYILTGMLAGGSPKPVPKMTNQVYNTMVRIGAIY